jgi:hypothetical protein
MTGHYITWTISKDSFGLDVKIECREPADAVCRVFCSGDCEYWCHSDDDPTRCCYCGKPLRTGQDCNALLFMDGSYAECYGGPDNHPLWDGLIEVQWEGEDDGYSWRYPEPDDQPTLAGETP